MSSFLFEVYFAFGAAAFFVVFAFFVVAALLGFFAAFLVDVFAAGAAPVEGVDEAAAVADLAAPFDALVFDFVPPAAFFFGAAAFFFGLLAVALPVPFDFVGALDLGLAIQTKKQYKI